MKKIFVMVLVCLTVALTGCGKTIPKCGDEQVQGFIKDIYIKNVNDFMPKVTEEYTDVVNAQFSNTNMILRINGNNFNTVEVFSVTPIYSQKLNGFTSQKIDKDSGKNYCTASNDSSLTFDIIIKINDNLIKTLSPEQIANALNVIKSEVDEYAVSQGTPNTSVIKGNVVIDSVHTQVPKQVSYATQMTDKGDQLIVTLGETK